jgi:hypothetical protein
MKINLQSQPCLCRGRLSPSTERRSREILAAHISKYDITQTIDTVERLYLEKLSRAPAKSDRLPG